MWIEYKPEFTLAHLEFLSQNTYANQYVKQPIEKDSWFDTPKFCI